MRNRFDQLVKRLVRKGFSGGGRVETEAEVAPDTLRVDVWFWPDAEPARKVLAPLGLLGRMGRKSCTLEACHRTPSAAAVADCVAKHRFFCRELARRNPRPPAPMQWVISSGRCNAALVGLGFRRSRWGQGIYDGPAMTRTRIVVVSELPRTRDTLLVRLMGAGKTLEHAIADARALPSDAPERRLALPILVRLRLEIPTDPAKQTKIDREFLMTTQEIDRYLAQIEEEGHEAGRQKGREEGFAQAVLAAYRARFGTPPPALSTAVQRASDHATLQRWLTMVTTRSADEVAQALRQTRSKQPTKRTSTRRSAAPRRAAAAR